MMSTVAPAPVSITRRIELEKSGSVTERQLLARIRAFAGSPAKRHLSRSQPLGMRHDAELRPDEGPRRGARDDPKGPLALYP